MESKPATKHDVTEGSVFGAVGGAIVGGFAGGPVGAIIGAVVGGAASAGAVSVVNKHDGDNRGAEYHTNEVDLDDNEVIDVDTYAADLHAITPAVTTPSPDVATY